MPSRPNSSLPPLNALRAFVAAARHGSFRAAAEELCVTTGAVSRQIRLLEDWLGLTLFDRSRRQVRLTPVGARYFVRVADLFDQLATATGTLREEKSGKVIHLDCIPTFAMHWLLPRLPAFKTAFPDVELSLFTAPDRIDLSRPLDYAIRRDPGHFAGLAPHPLMAERSAPVCSPQLLKEVNGEAMPDGLAGRTVIAIRARPDLWPNWCAANRIGADRLRNRLDVDHTYVAIQAAEDGLGIALVPLLFIERQLADGRLVPVPGCPAAETGRYFLLEHRHPDHTALPGLADWLRGQESAAQDSSMMAV
ncbi:LysR substrate-binding domain-containing protein [Azospirillum largimobile]